MLRKLGIGALALVGGCLGLFAAAFAVAQTGPARDQISGYVADTLSNPQRQAEVEQLGGLLPFDIRLGRFALRDDKGVWLEVNDARVKLNPGALLKGRVHVEEAGARRVAVDHLPPSGPEPPPSDEPFRLPEAPELPEALPTARLDRLHVDRIEVGAPVLGEAAVFSLEGRGGTDEAGKTADATLALRRTDEATASLDLAAKLDLATRRLGISLKGDETGGLLAAATGRPEAGPLRLSLEGDGPLDDWRGRLLVDAERLARLETTLDLAYASTRRVRVDGTFTAAPGVLPANIAPVVGERVTLALHAGETGPGLFALERLLLQAGALSLDGRGTADTNADRLEGRVQLQVPALASLSGLAGVPLAGRAGLTLDASGRVAEPALRLGVDGADIAADRVTLARLGGGYDVTLLRDAAGSIGGARVSGSVDAEGLAVEGRQVGEGGRAALEVRAEVPPAGQVRVERLALTSGIADLAVAGAVDRATLAGQLRLDGGVPDLSVIASLLPPETAANLPPLRGALALDGEAKLTGNQADRIDARLGLTGERLAGLPPGAQELLGPTPKLEARATVEQKKAVRVETIRLDGAAVSLAGNPTLGLDRKLGGGLTLDLPDLSRLEPALKQPVGGRLTAKAGLGGTLDAPALTLDAAGDALRFGEELIDRVTLAGRAAGPVDNLAGDARLAAVRGDQELGLAGDYALAGKRPPPAAAGADRPADAAGRERRGRPGEHARLGPARRRRGRLAAPLGVAQAEARPGRRPPGHVRHPRRRSPGCGPEGRGARDRRRLRQARPSERDRGGARPAWRGGRRRRPGARDGLQPARAGGERGGARREGSARRPGPEPERRRQPADQPFDLRAQAEVAALGEPRSVNLRSFGGRLAGQRLELVSPARLSLDGGVLDLDQLDLKVGPAQVQGSLRYGNGQARGEVRLAALPLGMLEGFGRPRCRGTRRVG
jgi:translocation and assembly module TamB